MFKKNKKKIISFLLLALVIFSSLNPPIYAFGFSENNQEHYRWLNVSGICYGLDCVESTFIVEVLIQGYNGVTFSNGTIVLEKINGNSNSVVRRWANLSSSTSIFHLYDETVPRRAGTYRLSFSIYAVRNGINELITGEKTITTT